MSTRNSSRSVTPYARNGRRQNPRNSSVIADVTVSSTITTRAAHGSRVPYKGDKNVEAEFLSNASTTWK